MRAFFDTNVLVYASVRRDARHVVARRILAGGGSISVQVLNEFANVAHRKLRMSWVDIRSTLRGFASVLHPFPLALATHESALALAAAHGFAVYDALIVASALEAKCTTLYTEDMQHGMIVEPSLRITNPFVDESFGDGEAS